MVLNPFVFVINVCFYVVMSFIILSSEKGFASLTALDDQGVNRQALSAVCDYAQNLLEIEINRSESNLSTLQRPVFQFHFKMSLFYADPATLDYRWIVIPPEGSMVSTQPIDQHRLILEPDMAGIYQITLMMEDPSGQCQYVDYVFPYYYDMDEEEIKLLPSIHAISPWRAANTF